MNGVKKTLNGESNFRIYMMPEVNVLNVQSEGVLCSSDSKHDGFIFDDPDDL